MHHIIFDFFTGMDGTGHALEGLEVPIKDKTFFTIFFEVDNRMRRILQHHRVHQQASLCNIALKTKDRLLVFFLFSPLLDPFACLHLHPVILLPVLSESL